jgi:cell division protease FtsH|uniref:ATP-dependent zinc metalloprotease FtsH n=1 Tax=Acanthoceras zachariasii TaxID=451788 RepID=A0A2U9NTJ8_9STRA|nr:putative plastid division protein [Acanthoceras zachariasii]AWT40470.1 putative plastid division protein [Acanthoceras zachariasii]
MGRNTFRNIIIAIIVIASISIGIKKFDLLGLESPETIRNTAQLNQNVVSSRMTYGRFLEYLEMGWVKQVDLYDNSRNAIIQASSPELGNRPQTIRVEIPVGASQLIQKLKEYNIDFDAHPAERKNLFISLASNIILPILFISGLIYFFQNSENLGGTSGPSPMNLGKSTARFERRPDTGITFKDIAGIDEAKGEFEEIVSFLKEPEKYTIVGAKIPKGILLVGPPGTGKTLLAKAIANEADVPFFSVAGSEFVEMFIGIGAARVRDLFKKASENAPCIVFIDEIDAVGRERGAGVGGGNDEREQTLNQLLTEMDGFKENKGVIVVGATNRVDILDAALLRPGRFDRQVTVNLPDRLGRVEILKVHARNKPLSDDVSLVQLANRTPGFSGADLANLLNEAAILATRYKKSKITKKEVNEAADRIIGGIAGTPLEDTKNKRLIAYHEVGHAITGTVLKSHDELEKITLTPRGGAKGLTWFTPNEDQTLLSRAALLARIIATLGGRAAEQVVFGEPEITTGASSDLQQVTNLARQMVTRFGMSNIGPMALEDENTGQVFLGGNMTSGSEYAENIADRIDDEVCKIINYCEQKAIEIISDNRVIIDLIVEKLLDVETMDGDEFRKLLTTYTVLPNKNTPYQSKFN